MASERKAAVEVLRTVWSAEEPTVDDLDEAFPPAKAYKNMKDISFDGMAEPGSDLRKASATGWSARAGSTGPAEASATWSSAPTRLAERCTTDGEGALDGSSDTVAQLTETLHDGGYLADRGLATALFVSLSLNRPILLEGEVGVGNTEVAQAGGDQPRRRVRRPRAGSRPGSAVGYIGVLGSRRTQQARADWLAYRGVADLARVHGSAGLNVGASTPTEIAVSILAEALAVRSDATPGPLRERSGSIH